jgi:hypothetical protein
VTSGCASLGFLPLPFPPFFFLCAGHIFEKHTHCFFFSGSQKRYTAVSFSVGVGLFHSTSIKLVAWPAFPGSSKRHSMISWSTQHGIPGITNFAYLVKQFFSSFLFFLYCPNSTMLLGSYIATLVKPYFILRHPYHVTTVTHYQVQLAIKLPHTSQANV